jgi:uncharacterized protein (DUF2062 family)
VGEIRATALGHTDADAANRAERNLEAIARREGVRLEHQIKEARLLRIKRTRRGIQEVWKGIAIGSYK